MITRTTYGLIAGIAALVLVAAACSSTSAPEAVEPAPTEAAADTLPDATAPVATAAQRGDTTTSIAEPDAEVQDDEVAEPEPPAEPVPEALQFSAPLVGGGEIDLAAGFANKPTVFWFWAPT